MEEKIIVKIEQISGKFLDVYLPVYLKWLTAKIDEIGPFGSLSIAGGLVIALAVYVWFRHRE